jgi:hypothetical protein
VITIEKGAAPRELGGDGFLVSVRAFAPWQREGEGGFVAHRSPTRACMVTTTTDGEDKAADVKSGRPSGNTIRQA